MTPELTRPADPPPADPNVLPDDPDHEVERIIREYEEGRVTSRATFASEPNLSYEEFCKLLDEMAALGMGDAPPLPADWSRHYLYEDE